MPPNADIPWVSWKNSEIHATDTTPLKKYIIPLFVYKLKFKFSPRDIKRWLYIYIYIKYFVYFYFFTLYKITLGVS